MTYEIEDRRKRKHPAMGHGMFVVWEVRAAPFPHRSYAGKFATKKEAQEAVKRLTSKSRQHCQACDGRGCSACGRGH